jgi:hypothetical protein
MGYSAEFFEFTATLPQTTLTFDSTTLNSAAGPVIDGSPSPPSAATPAPPG